MQMSLLNNLSWGEWAVWRKRTIRTHAPLSRHLGGPSAWRSAAPVCAGAQPRREVCPACWPRPSHLPMPPDAAGRSQPFPDSPATSSGTAQLVALGGLCFCKSKKAVHLEAKRSACGCQVWSCGQSKPWNGFSVSVSFYTKGTSRCTHPFVLTPLLHSPFRF